MKLVQNKIFIQWRMISFFSYFKQRNVLYPECARMGYLAQDTQFLCPSHTHTSEHSQIRFKHTGTMFSRLQMQFDLTWKVSLVYFHTFTGRSIMDRYPYQMLCVPWAQRHHCEAKKPVQENKHLSCANWSVKCTNCRGEARVIFPRGWQL